jgi:hypothetical protein
MTATVNIVQIFFNEASKFWQPWCSDPAKYAVGIDYDVGYKNGRSGFVQSLSANRGDWGCLLQSIDAHEYRGKRVRFGAFIQSEEVVGWCGLNMCLKGAMSNTVAYTDMWKNAITGTQDWTECALVLDVPTTAYYATICATLQGEGRVMFSRFVLEEVGSDIPTTDRDSEACNLDFAMDY